MPLAALLIDDRDVVVAANPRSGQVFGHPAAQLVGLPIRALVPAWSSDWPTRARAEHRADPLDRPLGEGEQVGALRAGGAAVDAELLLAPVVSPGGSFTIVVVKDVALRQELLSGEEHLALSQRVAGMGSWENDLTTGRVHFSRQLYRLLNIEPGSLVPRAETFFDQVHPADLHALLAEVGRASSKGGPFLAQVRVIPRPWSTGDPLPAPAAEGVMRTVAVRGSIDLDDAARPVRTVGTVTDVTARVTLERALRSSDQRFQAAFDQAPIGAALIDARPGHHPTHLMVNRALTQLTGRSVPELLELTTLDLAHPEDRSQVAHHLSGLALPGHATPPADAGIPGVGRSPDVRLVHPDGQDRWVCLSSTLVRDHDGVPDYAVTHLVEVTDRHRAEAEALQRAARDERIAAVLQHDLMPWVPDRLGPVRTAYRYRPAGTGETVCGDWADVFPLPDGRIGVVVGDVAGHGIEAAATMTRLRTVVHLLATSGVSPAGVMRRLNETLHETDLGDDIQLATLVHGQLDPTTGTFLYCSAGHLPMLTLTSHPAGGRSVASPVPAVGGPPIGVLPDWKYTQQAVVLERAGLLVGYTDGLIERRDQGIDESFLALLAALNELPDHTRTDVEALADALLTMSPPRSAVADDIAVVVLALDPGHGHGPDPDPQPVGPRRQRVDLADVALPPDRWA